MSRQFVQDQIQMLRLAQDEINREILKTVREAVVSLQDNTPLNQYEILQQLFDDIYKLTEASMEMFEDQEEVILQEMEQDR